VALLLRPESDPWRIEDLKDRVRLIRGWLTQPEALAPPLADFRPEVVYHLGWSGSAPPDRSDPRAQAENVEGALALAELAAASGAGTWVGLGSQAEYGPAAAVLDESTPPRPVSEYGKAKLSAGRSTAELCERRSVRHVWLRLLTAYGPADHPAYLVPHVILALLQGRRPALTAGTQPGDFLHVTDAARAIRAAGTSDSCTGTYVLSSGRHVPVREVALTIRDMIDARLEIGLGEVVANPAPVGLRGDPTALKLATGWSPQVSLEEGLAGCVEWYRRNLSRYPKENGQ
jgi:nucleoside-diphosphate-sugar epimerase